MKYFKISFAIFCVIIVFSCAKMDVRDKEYTNIQVEEKKGEQGVVVTTIKLTKDNKFSSKMTVFQKEKDNKIKEETILKIEGKYSGIIENKFTGEYEGFGTQRIEGTIKNGGKTMDIKMGKGEVEEYKLRSFTEAKKEAESILNKTK